ncbi:vascular endothelial growth factor receptor 3-like [Anopheles albimanus]|uniref:vascular endothelial growth factor receptor 3-like n=1 Tax=Anopheles albimanus TaxID=7167 RepID=UPI00163EF8F9|nr:vascular endothelial growth factor receptor 3-like [Anopheles albimanus]
MQQNPPNVTSIAFTTGDVEMQYGAILTITNASAAVVGRYYCVPSARKDEDLDDMVSEELASNIYVFVRDYKQPLVSTPKLMYYNQSEEVLVPCKPSYQDVEVELCNKVDQCLSLPNDATKGYRISKASLKIPLDGVIVCKGNNTSYTIQLLTSNYDVVNISHMAPITDLIDNDIILQYGVTWNVTCKSNKPIIWMAYDAWYEWNPPNFKSTPFTTGDKEMQHGATLTITNASAASVGRYYCVESEKSEEDLDEMIKQKFATSVYVFVIDHKQPLVPVNYETRKKNRGKRFVIPCKPSYPDAHVELCYESGGFCMTKCDPSSGFSIYDDTFYTSLEAFVCRCNQIVNHIPKLEMVGSFG